MKVLQDYGGLLSAFVMPVQLWFDTVQARNQSHLVPRAQISPWISNSMINLGCFGFSLTRLPHKPLGLLLFTGVKDCIASHWWKQLVCVAFKCKVTGLIIQGACCLPVNLFELYLSSQAAKNVIVK